MQSVIFQWINELEFMFSHKKILLIVFSILFQQDSKLLLNVIARRWSIANQYIM